MARSRRRRYPPPRYNGNWLRDRDMIGAWAFRGLAIAFFTVITWNVTSYTKTVDELKVQVPLLTNTVAALTDELKSEQAQIGKLWEHIFDSATGTAKKK